MRRQAPIIGVIGKGGKIEASLSGLAFNLGRSLGAIEPQPVVVTGGLGGTMAAAARGAHATGAIVISLVPANRDFEIHEHATVVLRTDLTESYRNVLMASVVEAMVMLPGSYGTMTEAAVAIDRKVPMVWCGDHTGRPTAAFSDLPGAIEPDEALLQLIELVGL